MPNTLFPSSNPRLLRCSVWSRVSSHTAGFGFSDVSRWALHLAKALQCLAAAQPEPIVHGDLSLRNLLVTAGGQDVVLSDVGIAMRTTRGGTIAACHSQPRSAHLPPEVRLQLSGLSAMQQDELEETLLEYVADPKYDMWSFGVIMYQLATKQEANVAFWSGEGSIDCMDALAGRDDLKSHLAGMITASWGAVDGVERDAMCDAMVGTLRRQPGCRMSAAEVIGVLRGGEFYAISVS